MRRLASQVRPGSEDFRTNDAAMRALSAELKQRLKAAARGGPDRARELHESRGKLLPRTRVERLLDPGSPFLELSPLAAGGMYDDQAPGGSILTGSARSTDARP